MFYVCTYRANFNVGNDWTQSLLFIKFIKQSDVCSLVKNQPNPSVGNTNISFEIPNSTYVSVKVYNTTGVEVAELAGKKYPQGKHTLTFDSKNLSQGIYVYVLHADNYSASKKLSIK